MTYRDPYGDPIWLQHYTSRLALHRLKDKGDTGHPLLLLHGLGEHTRETVPEVAAHWPGAIFGLDFTGHGRSTVPIGGGYSAEILLGDVDAALARIGPCTVMGRGIGAYVALMIAGARPTLVRGAVLGDGPGISGGPIGPASSAIVRPPEGAVGPPDPWALVELSRDPRPPDYATTYARLAVEHSEVDPAIAVCCVFEPPWLAAVALEPGVARMTVTEALTRYA